jgi:hypothetical protein
MSLHFSKHYTIEEARALLPEARNWLAALGRLQDQLNEAGARIDPMLDEGADAGGEPVNQLVTALADCKDLLREFRSREIQIKDLDRGLLDFPSLRDGREVFLCWEKAEDDIQFWHDLESGYAGREPL